MSAVNNPPYSTETQLQTILNHLPVVLYSLDRDGIITFSEGKGLETLGFRSGQLVGQSVFELYASEPELLVNIRRAVAGEEMTVNATVKALDLHWETRWTPLKDDGGELLGTVGVTFDITERVRAQRERDQLLVEAQAAIQAREDFISIASHELRTPLTSLKMQLELIPRLLTEARVPAAGRFCELMRHALGQLDKFSRLGEDLLDASRIHVGKIMLDTEDADLCEIVHRVVAQHRSEIELGKYEVRLLLKPDAIVGHWDPTRVEQIVCNLMSNALKYGEGCPVEIEVQRMGDRARVIVRDQGIGIAPEHQERIFGRFERGAAPSRFRGLGIGLYVTRELARAHGGDVRVRSELGRGSEFTVELPGVVQAARAG